MVMLVLNVTLTVVPLCALHKMSFHVLCDIEMYISLSWNIKSRGKPGC